MDSLVASYASSDEEEDRRETFAVKSSSSRPSSSSSSSSSLFSVIPKPKEHRFDSSPSSLPKRIVQIRLPINPRSNNLDDEEEEEEEEKARKKKRKEIESSAASLSHDSSVKSFLSAMPAPKKSTQTLGSLLPPSLGSVSSRRSNLETETHAITQQTLDSSGTDQQVDNNYYDTGYGGYESNHSVGSSVGGVYVGYGDDSNSSYNGNAWNCEAKTVLPEAFVAMDSGARRGGGGGGGRRGRNDMPTEIVEIKQDDLVKNRPRVDQVKSTGIAFGPAYQPASSSSKGKVSKLHKRKHQITALFMDMKHKETELAERRSKGFLTKAETQAKYGW
ncbi:unnamed protein product [Cochlearia groenlandica]